MWQKIKNFLYYISRSSADPAAMSLVVRGFLVGVVAFIVQWAPLACTLVVALCIDTSQLQPFVDGLVAFVKAGLEVVAAVLMIYGAGRKIYYGRVIHPEAV